MTMAADIDGPHVSDRSERKRETPQQHGVEDDRVAVVLSDFTVGSIGTSAAW